MIVRPKAPLLMLIRLAIGQLMLVGVWKKIEIDFSRNNVFFGDGLSGSIFVPLQNKQCTF
jgi:hypothetical protein